PGGRPFLARLRSFVEPGVGQPWGRARASERRRTRLLLESAAVADIDLVIFDLDGTLVDTAPDIAGALGATLAQVGVAAPPLAIVKQMVGDGARELIRRALEHAGVEADLNALHAALLAHYR